MRKAAVMGTFYEKGETTLLQQLQECFEGERGPGALPPELQKNRKAPLPKAILVPHAGYKYSGACAAWAYKTLGEAPIADVYIILAPSHHSTESGLTQEPFETPLGIVRVDQDLARRLLEKGTIKENPIVHEQEHSIEVQLPFLQFINKGAIEKLKILPILVGHDLDITTLAIDMKEILLDTGKKAVFIVSTDLTHYGRNYHYLPFTADVQENISLLDKGALDIIKKGDGEGFLAYIEEHMMTLCGSYAVAFLLKLIKANKVNLEQYYTSTAVTGDQKNSVSYAAMTFY
jgi:AmmeMemoRadiSam system protein B